MTNEGSVVWDLISRDRSSSTNEKVGRSFDRLNHQTSAWGSTLGKLSSAAKYGALALGGLASVAVVTGVKTLASMETTQVGFETLLGSAKKANDYLAWMKKFAAATPFELEGLVDSSRLLLGVGETAKEAQSLLQDFGDTAGAVGMDQQHFQMAMLATSQMISAGKLKLGDLNQLMNDGIPIWKLLSEALGKPVPKIQEMISKGQLLTKDVLPKLQAQMHKDYGGAMSRQSETLTGLWSTLSDTFTLGMADALLPFEHELKTGLKGAIEIVGETLKKVPGWVHKAQDALSGIDFSKLFGDAKDLWNRAKHFGEQIIGGVQAAMQTHDWTDLGNFLGTALGSALKDLGSQLQGAMGGVDWYSVGESIGSQMNTFATGFFSGLINAVGDPSNAKVLQTHWKATILAVLAVIPFGEGGSIVGRILAKVGLGDGVLARWIVKPIERMAGAAKDAVWSLVRFIGRQFGGAFEKASGGAARAASGFVKDIIETGILKALYAGDKIKAGARWLVGLIPRTIGSMVGKLYSDLRFLAGQMIDGLVVGIRLKVEDLKSAVQSIASSIPQWLRNKLKIQSPSKVTALIGRQVVDGLVHGIHGQTKTAKSAVDKLVDVVGAALDRHRSKLADLKSSYGDLRRSVVDAFRIDLSGAGSNFSDIMSNFRDTASSDKRMASVIKRLRKMGLRSDLLQQLASQGAAGLGQANSILGAGRAGIQQLNSVQRQIVGYGYQAGNVVAQQQYGTAIAREAAAAKTLTKVQHDLTAEVRQLNKLLKSGHKHIDAAALRRELYKILKQGHALGAA